MLLCFFFRLRPQEIEKASPDVKSCTKLQPSFKMQKLFSVWSDFFKQRYDFIHLDSKYFIAILNCVEITRRWAKNLPFYLFCFFKTAPKKSLLFLDCISNWLRNCLLHGVTTGFCPCNSLLGNKSINFLEDASDPTPTRANLKGNEERYNTIVPFSDILTPHEKDYTQ